ncbi:MAG: TIM barrel protein [Geminicoccaceae bacterium]
MRRPLHHRLLVPPGRRTGRPGAGRRRRHPRRRRRAHAGRRAGALIETEEGFWADTGANSAALVRAAGDVGLGINWDPANSLCGGDHPYPDGYEALAGLVRNVHFKDARATPAGGEFVADGEVGWAGQIAALKRDGYGGYIAVEPHLAPSVRSVRTALERLRGLIG